MSDEKAKTHLRIPRQFLFRINIDCNQIDGVTGGPGSKIWVVGHFLEDGRNDAAGCAPTIRVRVSDNLMSAPLGAVWRVTVTRILDSLGVIVDHDQTTFRVRFGE